MQLAQRIADIHAKEPPRDLQMTICINAWWDLSTCRMIGMALGPIPVTEIYQWCEAEGFDQTSARIIKGVIRILDNDRAEREASKARRDKITGGK